MAWPSPVLPRASLGGEETLGLSLSILLSVLPRRKTEMRVEPSKAHGRCRTGRTPAAPWPELTHVSHSDSSVVSVDDSTPLSSSLHSDDLTS